VVDVECLDWPGYLGCARNDWSRTMAIDKISCLCYNVFTGSSGVTGLFGCFILKEITMVKIGATTARLIKAAPGSNFIFGAKENVPYNTCKKYGVTLRSTECKSLGIKIVTRV
jgi:hypothetical protein